MKSIESNVLERELPEIIQGGMGAGVSNWRLARSVALAGEMGVISGTALDTVMIRRLQDGDKDGATRRALAAFPYQQMVKPILVRWYVHGGRKPEEPYRLKPLPSVMMSREDEELLIVANFVEVYLAKEGHDGLVGINLLEKIQLPTLPSLFGALLADVDVVLMGGGIPLAIPGVLDAMAKLQPVELKLNLVNRNAQSEEMLTFHPGTYVSAKQEPLKRPLFFAVISSEVLAKTLVKKASGKVDGFVVENHSAGGHNAPPRREGAYGDKDVCDPAKVAELGLPFWIAGGCGSPEGLQEAKALGARGVQVGTIFALSEESGILPEIKAEMVERYRNGTLEVITDFKASPTAYPFKRVELDSNAGPEPSRTCDLGYLRHVFTKEDGTIGYRCPAAPRKQFYAKGGTEAEADGKLCLCNGLLATIGLGQVRGGRAIPPLVTSGEDFSFLDKLLSATETVYSAKDVIEFLKGKFVAAGWSV